MSLNNQKWLPLQLSNEKKKSKTNNKSRFWTSNTQRLLAENYAELVFYCGLGTRQLIKVIFNFFS